MAALQDEGSGHSAVAHRPIRYQLPARLSFRQGQVKIISASQIVRISSFESLAVRMSSCCIFGPELQIDTRVGPAVRHSAYRASGLVPWHFSDPVITSCDVRSSVQADLAESTIGVGWRYRLLA
jgi:hypothetical protein